MSRAASATTGLVRVGDGVELEYTDGGAAGRTEEALPLLLLHGFTGSMESWRESLSTLGVSRRVIAISLVGHGASDVPADPARYAAHRVAGDVIAVLDALAIPRVALLGYSMGGRVALHAALAAPERIAALLLESASPGIEDPVERADRRDADDALARSIERDGVEAFVARWERLPMWDSQQRLPAQVREGLRAQRLASSEPGLANSLRGLGAGVTSPLHSRLRDVRMSTLLLCGELDTKYHEIAARMMELLPNAEMHVVAAAGHAAHLENPAAFAAAISDFLDRMDVPSTEMKMDGGTHDPPRAAAVSQP